MQGWNYQHYGYSVCLLGPMKALISVSVALSQTPAEAAITRTRGCSVSHWVPCASRMRGKIISTVLCCIVYHSTQLYMHTHMSNSYRWTLARTSYLSGRTQQVRTRTTISSLLAVTCYILSAEWRRWSLLQAVCLHRWSIVVDERQSAAA